MAISPNGYIARENGDEDWVPIENWDDFLVLATKYNNIVMGRETFEQVTSRYSNFGFTDVTCDHKVIVTGNDDFRAPDGYVLASSPEAALSYIENQGLSKLFLIGGGKINSAFMKRGMVDEIIFIINPYILGKGRPVLAPDNFDLTLKLESSQVLSKDRVRLHYKVTKIVH